MIRCSNCFDGNKKECRCTLRGGDRIRTGVQTWFSKAFYMLISELFVGKKPELNKPIPSLAESS